MWITHTGQADQPNSKAYDTDDFDASSHHFNADFLGTGKRKIPKTARTPTTPLIVKRHQPPDARFADLESRVGLPETGRQLTARR
jgi:hypothetical protein